MKRLEFVDSLRGLAALSVVFCHVAFIPSPILHLPRWLRAIVPFGATGVTLFFVVSAFSLFLTMPRHIESGKPWTSYAVSRLFRIAPLFYLMLVFSCLRDAFLFKTAHPPLEVLASAFFVFNFVPGWQVGIVWASWTVGVECAFYALFPLIYLTCGTLRRKLTLLLSLILLGYFRTKLMDPVYANATILHFLPIFVIGAIAYDLYRRLKERSECTWMGMALTAFGLIGLVALFLRRLPIGPLDFNYVGAVFYASLLVGLGLWHCQLIVNRLSRFYGVISYSVYLLHPPIIYAITPLFRLIYANSISNVLSYFVCSALTLVAVTPVSMLVYVTIEKPAIRLGRKLFAEVLLFRFRAYVAEAKPAVVEE
jgi:peptidoglycan/LPS O-acetylase OafA/YrhL